MRPESRGLAGESTRARSTYRPDIQGLRAVAVLAVIAFHAGLPVPGGFAGVDVFFVISGFVITSMIQREFVATGGVRLPRFYFRRIMRLTPALALLVSVTMTLTAVILSPLGPQQTAAQTGLGAMLLAANLVIAKTSGGYFDPSAEQNPLLNTWSLSVEEQFYLVLPILIVLGWLLAKRQKAWKLAPWVLVGLLLVASGTLAGLSTLGVSLGESSWLFGFYSPLTRAWEFCAGVLLALAIRALGAMKWKVAFLLSFIGAMCVVVSFLVMNSEYTWPGKWTVLPVLGTVLILAGGARSGHPNPISRVLSAKPMVLVGNWSYSMYLWHWPVIVFAIYLWPSSVWAPLFAAGISMIPALVAYRFVEKPLRSLRVSGPWDVTKFLMSVWTPPLVLSLLVWSAASQYWEPRYQAGEMSRLYESDGNWTDFYAQLSKVYFPCSNAVVRNLALEWEGIERCRQSRPSSEVDVALIGDSHAEALFTGLSEKFRETNFAYYVQGTLPVRADPAMKVILEEVARDSHVRTVVINADWAERGVQKNYLVDTLTFLTRAGKRVIVMDDVPVYEFDPVTCQYGLSPWLPLSRCSVERSDFQRRYNEYAPELESAVKAVPGVHLANTARFFCDDISCDMTRDGRLLYRDNNHINSYGSRFLAERIADSDPFVRESLSPEASRFWPLNSELGAGSWDARFRGWSAVRPSLLVDALTLLYPDASILTEFICMQGD